MKRSKPKILCLCQAGTSRSVSLAHLLKYKYGCDALAASLEQNTPKTLVMLCEWADHVIVVHEPLCASVPHEGRKKLKVYDVGPDRWAHPLHPQLLALFDSMISAEVNRNGCPV